MASNNTTATLERTTQAPQDDLSHVCGPDCAHDGLSDLENALRESAQDFSAAAEEDYGSEEAHICGAGCSHDGLSDLTSAITENDSDSMAALSEDFGTSQDSQHIQKKAGQPIKQKAIPTGDRTFTISREVRDDRRMNGTSEARNPFQEKTNPPIRIRGREETTNKPLQKEIVVKSEKQQITSKAQSEDRRETYSPIQQETSNQHTPQKTSKPDLIRNTSPNKEHSPQHTFKKQSEGTKSIDKTDRPQILVNEKARHLTQAALEIKHVMKLAQQAPDISQELSVKLLKASFQSLRKTEEQRQQQQQPDKRSNTDNVEREIPSVTAPEQHSPFTLEQKIIEQVSEHIMHTRDLDETAKIVLENCHNGSISTNLKETLIAEIEIEHIVQEIQAQLEVEHQVVLTESTPKAPPSLTVRPADTVDFVDSKQPSPPDVLVQRTEEIIEQHDLPPSLEEILIETTLQSDQDLPEQIVALSELTQELLDQGQIHETVAQELQLLTAEMSELCTANAERTQDPDNRDQTEASLIEIFREQDQVLVRQLQSKIAVCCHDKSIQTIETQTVKQVEMILQRLTANAVITETQQERILQLIELVLVRKKLKRKYGRAFDEMSDEEKILEITSEISDLLSTLIELDEEFSTLNSNFQESDEATEPPATQLTEENTQDEKPATLFTSGRFSGPKAELDIALIEEVTSGDDAEDNTNY